MFSQLEPLENIYFNWLYAKVNDVSESSPSRQYNKLFRIFHTTEFYSIVSGDDNRVEDGLLLRHNFLDIFRLNDDDIFLSEPCSVLEMLIAFSCRAEFETEDSMQFWFWEMVGNLGLSGLNDARLKNLNSVRDIVHTFVSRKYDPNGHGGLFPLLKPLRDQQKTEIWYQFNAYLLEQRYS